jgi:hypothetical protein
MPVAVGASVCLMGAHTFSAVELNSLPPSSFFQVPLGARRTKR